MCAQCPDSGVADDRTLSHKAEHAIDLATGAIVSVTVQGAAEGDTTTIHAAARAG